MTVRCNYHCIDSNVCLLSDKPKSVSITAVSATAVNISWSGSIHLNTSLHYTVHCSSTGSVMSRYATALVPGVNWALVDIRDDITLGFQYRHDFTLYYFYSATNVVEPPSGPITTATFSFGKLNLLTVVTIVIHVIHTADKKYFQVQFAPIDYCLTWGVSQYYRFSSLLSQFFQSVKTAGIRSQLQSYLINIIRNNCSECEELTSSFLRPGVFLCHHNPSKTTYRSTLINPFPTTTTTRLVGIIQSWVSMGPSLILDGLLVRVSGECPTAISSLDEGECESGVSGDPGLGQRITQTLNECAVRNLGQEVCSLGGCPLPD